MPSVYWALSGKRLFSGLKLEYHTENIQAKEGVIVLFMSVRGETDGGTPVDL